MKILKEQHGFVCAVCSVVSDSVTPWTVESTRLLCLWDSPGKNTGVGCHFLLQGIFLTRELNLRLLYWQADSLLLSHLGNPKKKKKKECSEDTPHTVRAPTLPILSVVAIITTICICEKHARLQSQGTPQADTRLLLSDCFSPLASQVWSWRQSPFCTGRRR